MDEIGKIDWVCHFVSLKELTISNNSVVEIEVSLGPAVIIFQGVDKCLQLEKLWLSFNQIEVIKNLENLVALKLLVLSSNKIRKIKALEKLTNL